MLFFNTGPESPAEELIEKKKKRKIKSLLGMANEKINKAKSCFYDLYCTPLCIPAGQYTGTQSKVNHSLNVTVSLH